VWGEHTDYYLMDLEFVKEFLRIAWLKRIEFIRLDVGNSEQLPVSSRTLIDDNIGFERGK
jgi:hypothetical protein